MRDLNQSIIKFNHDQNFTYDDFYVSKSNEHVFDLLFKWPKWEKNFININGEKFSGKTHLINIFLNKFNGLKLEASALDNNDLKKIKIHQNIVLENLNEIIDERILYTFLNIVDQDNKYLIITSNKPIVNYNFSLIDLKSRTNNFILCNLIFLGVA